MEHASIPGVLRCVLPAGLLALTLVVHAGPVLAQSGNETVTEAEAARATSVASFEVIEPESVAISVPLEVLEKRLTPLTREELASEAEAARRLAREKVEELVEAEIAAQAAAGDEAAVLQAQVTRLFTERGELFSRLGTVLNAWEGKGGDADAIAEYRQYMSAVTTEGIKTTDASTMLSVARNWLTSPEGGIALAFRGAGLVVAFFLLLVVAKFISSLAARGLTRVSGLSTLLKNFLMKAAFVGTLVLGLLVVLSMMGVDMGPVFAVVGGASFIIAFAMQSTLSNFAAGLMIMIYKPFDVGNYVNVAGVAGTVKEVSLVSTTLATPDNQVITVPNGNVWGSIITNVTVNETRRVDLVFGIAYDDDAEKAIGIMEEVVKAHPLVLEDPAPVIRMHELADSSVNFICRPWTKTSDYWAVYWDLTQQVKRRFDEEGISIPFPQRDVHVYNHTVAPQEA
jgi:small conductance mechanosensitive channel